MEKSKKSLVLEFWKGLRGLEWLHLRLCELDVLSRLRVVLPDGELFRLQPPVLGCRVEVAGACARDELDLLSDCIVVVVM